MPDSADHPSRITFLCYASRSGSTLLATRLAADFDVAVAPEFQTAYWLLTRPPGAPVLPHDLRRHLSVDRQLANAEVETLLAACAPASLPADVLERLGRARAEGASPESPLLFKLGGVLSIWSLVRGHFPHARAINIIRDGRAVTNSLLNSPRPYGGPGAMGRSDSVHCARQWRTQVAVQTGEARRQPERIHQLRYEDLLADFGGETRLIADFTGWHAQSSTASFAVPRTEADIHTHVQGPTQPARIAAWRSELSRRDRLVVERLAGQSLRDHSYGEFLTGVSRSELWTTMARAWARHLVIQVGDVTRRLRDVESLSAFRGRLVHRWKRLRRRSST